MPKIVTHTGMPEQATPKVEVKKEKQELRPDVKFTLPDGRDVTMGKPPIPTVVLLPAILGALKSNNNIEALYNEALVRAAIYVREIDNKPVTTPGSFEDVSRLVVQLGEDGADLIVDAYSNNFTPPSLDQLKNLKK